MISKSNNNLKSYINVSHSSGYVSANYNIINDGDTKISLVEDIGNEFSGEFKINNRCKK